MKTCEILDSVAGCYTFCGPQGEPNYTPDGPEVSKEPEYYIRFQSPLSQWAAQIREHKPGEPIPSPFIDNNREVEWAELINDLSIFLSLYPEVKANNEGIKTQPHITPNQPEPRGADNPPELERALSSNGETKKTYKTALGRNIDKYRIECGWSYDDLAKASGIDRRTIISHTSEGAKPRPANLKIYVDTFAKQLGRKITIADLTE